jgi:hypothetical protein
MKSPIDEMQELERQEQQIAKRKKQLAAKVEKEKQRLAQLEQEAREQAKWYDQVLKESKLGSPHKLIREMMKHFGIRSISAKDKRAAAASTPAAPAGVRTRTKVTPELLTKVKAALAAKTKKKDISETFGISYPTVIKIQNGHYD